MGAAFFEISEVDDAGEVSTSRAVVRRIVAAARRDGSEKQSGMIGGMALWAVTL
jgi:hypothetical protein